MTKCPHCNGEIPFGLDFFEGELRLLLANALHQVSGAVNGGADIEIVGNNAERVGLFTDAIGRLQQERQAKARAAAEEQNRRAIDERMHAATASETPS